MSSYIALFPIGWGVAELKALIPLPQQEVRTAPPVLHPKLQKSCPSIPPTFLHVDRGPPPSCYAQSTSPHPLPIDPMLFHRPATIDTSQCARRPWAREYIQHERQEEEWRLATRGRDFRGVQCEVNASIYMAARSRSRSSGTSCTQANWLTGVSYGKHRYEKEFEAVQDVFELQRNLNNCFAYDLVPSPSVITAALRAARRVNDFPTAVRIFEAIEAKVENQHQYEEYLEDLKPLREELGVNLKAELYPDPPS
ncbi:MAG: hypothetical protein Q9177_005534 [Variospora cf. flavescens]